MKYGPGHSVNCPANRDYSNAHSPCERPCPRFMWKLDIRKRKELNEQRRWLARIEKIDKREE